MASLQDTRKLADTCNATCEYQNIINCTILTMFSTKPILMSTPYHVCSV